MFPVACKFLIRFEDVDSKGFFCWLACCTFRGIQLWSFLPAHPVTEASGGWGVKVRALPRELLLELRWLLPLLAEHSLQQGPDFK